MVCIWKNDVDVSILCFSNNHIDMVVKMNDGEHKWKSKTSVVPGFMVDLKLQISTIHVILFIILLPLTLVRKN